jgi:predicted nucleic acid-binding protein
MIVLDTNILIEFEAHNLELIKFLQNLTKKFPSRPYITSANYSEFLYGFIKESPKKQEKAIEFLEDYKLLNTSKNSSRLLAKIKYELEKKGKMIPIFDVLIASIVMDKKAMLITFDEHFKNIEGLEVIIPPT